MNFAYFGAIAASFFLLLSYYVRVKWLRNIFTDNSVNKVLVVLIPSCVAFFLIFGYMIHSGDDDRIIWSNIDSVSYFTQARIFSSFKLAVPSHDLKEFFTTGFCINDGKYYSKYFPGWPLLLSVGVFAGIPWIVNPLIGFASLYVIYLVGREIFDHKTGIVAAVLLLTSGYFLTYTPTYFSEPSTILFSSLFFLCVLKAGKEGTVPWAILAGISIGFLFLIRPYSAVAFSLPLLFHLFHESFIRKNRPKGIIWCIVSFSFPFLVVLLGYNYLQTGSVFLSPFQYYNPFDKPGFGMRSFDIIIKPYPFDLPTGILNTLKNLFLINLDCAFLSIVFVLIAFMNRRDKWEIVLLLSFITVVLFQMIYFYRDTRYYSAGYCSLFILTARGINKSGDLIKKHFPGCITDNMGNMIITFILLVNLLLNFYPMKIFQTYNMSNRIRDPFDIVKRENIKNAVVFLRSVPMKDNYVDKYIQNALDYNGEVLFVKNLGERNTELMKYYPGKNFYYYDFDLNKGARTGKLSIIKNDMLSK